jgi:environmental stress-induced protein Ves
MSLLATLVALATAVGIGCQGSVEREYVDRISDLNAQDGGLPDVIVTPATIGGTVTSVLGTGLALRNNGKDDIVIPSSGAFAFPTPIFPGEPYAVTVRTQPTAPSQTCTVTNGTGVAHGVNVTNVTVACNTATYPIGGTISELSGSGLVLQNNGGNDIVIAAGSNSFTFAAQVPSGGSYNISIKSQPSNQTCSVSGGTGVVVAGAVTSVVVNCGTNTHTVGGNISGLAGTVVLQNNGGNDRPLNANGSFAFSTPITSGASYSVTVKTQPGAPSANQTCVVSNGSGTIGSADVTDISVTCTTNKYTVGGTVSGMTGSGLVLRNNGADNVTVNANGAFTFPTLVASGGAYAATVLTAPANQACQVTNGAGTVGAGNVTSIAVACSTTNPLSENFDGVTAPALPAGWTSTVLVGNAGDKWTNATGATDSAPNAPFVPNRGYLTDVVLVSPAFTVGSSTAQLSFRNNWSFEPQWDGGALEIAIAGASFQDVIAAGGLFLSGGYNGTISTNSDATLSGRQAWMSSSGGFVNTTVRLPAAAAGKSVQLRWRMSSDPADGAAGWSIDTVLVTN